MTRWPSAAPHPVSQCHPISQFSRLALLLLLIAWPGWAAAQFRVRLGAEFEPDATLGKAGVPSGVLPVPGADERALREKLRLARAYADNSSDTRNHAQAAALYQNILESLENTAESGLQHDYFLPSEKEEKADVAVTVSATLRGEIDAALARLPADVWRTYQLRSGPTAQRLLDEAVAQGDAQALEKICRLYFYTEAGYQAAFLLGEACLSEGQPLSAARCFARLKGSPGARRFEPALSVKLAASYYLADDRQQALQTLEVLRKEFPRMMLNVSGRDIPGPGPGDQALAWLAVLVGERQPGGAARGDQWLVHRGNAARNAPSSGDEPIALRWRVRSSDNPQLVDEREGVVPYLMRRGEQRGQLALPSAQPLVVRRPSRALPRGSGDETLVVMRSLGGLVAIDLATGKRILQGDEPEPAVTDSPSPFNIDLFGRATMGSTSDSIERRLWDDATLGQLSSDGERVYQIKRPRVPVEDQDDEEAPRGRRRAMVAQPQTRPGNILQALNLSSDRGAFSVAWEIDGTTEPSGSPLAGVTFLGPPLPMRGALYVLAEFAGSTSDATSGDTRLLAIDPRTVDSKGRPKVLWSQRIAQFDDAMGSALHGDFRALGGFVGARAARRQAGLSPSAGDGILICPTGVGAVVAVDVSTRSLRWGFKYPLGGGSPDERPERRRGASSNVSEAPHWTDASVTVADGRVLLTSPLSQQLHCLSLADGKELWSAPREDGLYVAGVHEGKVIVVGSRKVRALLLAATDAGGKLAWSQSVELPSTARTAGRGFLTADSYYLPLSSAEIAVIDLRKGQLTKQLRSPEGRGLGNLIGYGDVVLSLGPLAIDCFEQRQALETSVRERLAKNATDPVALRDSARRALHDRKPEEAAGLLRQSLQARSDPQTKHLLIACLTQLIEADAVKHRPLLDELGGLVERRADRVGHLRLLADSLRRDGKPQEAMQTLLRLADVLGDRDVPSGDVTRSSAAVVATALAELYGACPADQRPAMDAAIEKVLAPALTAENARGLWEFLDHYGFHPLAVKARQELVSRAMAAPRESRPRESQSPAATAAAPGQVPARYEALWLLGQLEQSPDQAAVRWATAQKARLLAQAGQAQGAAAAYRRLRDEFADRVCIDDKTGKQLLSALAADSPVRRHLDTAPPTWPVGEVTTETLAGAPTNRSLLPVPLAGQAAWVAKTSLHFNPTANKLLARDSVGQRLWELQLDSPTVGLPRTVSRAVALGHLLIAQTGDEVVAIDVLHAELPTILWRRALADGPLGRGGQQALAPFANPWGFEAVYAAQLAGLTGAPQGRLGPVSSRYVCFENDETLTAVHPLTGRTLWSRRGAAGGGLLFGDDEVLVLLGAGGDKAGDKAIDKAIVLRAADGETIGQKTLVPAANVLGTVGSRLVAWESRDGKQSLRVLDAQGKEPRPLGEFAAGSKAAMIDDQAVAVLQPDGELAVLRVADGQAELRRKGLKLPNKLDRIHVVRSDDTYFVAISRPDDERERPWGSPFRSTFQLPSDDSSRPPVNGTVYALSRTGEDLWKEGPSRIDACSWALDQPSDLPVLVFLSDERGRGSQMRIKLVDKRTGRTVYDHRRPAPPDTFEIQGSPEQGVVTMLMQGGRVTLKFGKPKEAAPPKGDVPPKTEPAAKTDSPKK